MTQGRIRFSTSILSRLGEELNPNIDQGVLELVKNAYDADALVCQVELQSLGDSDTSIIVSDDGDGMSDSDILSGWLVLGSSIKETSSRTRLGRIPAGNKGLGRLAALRLGRLASMTTWPKGQAIQYQVELDWSRFDKAELVDDVEIAVHERSYDGQYSGTRITISSLRKPITRIEVKRLARAMILLADPFGEDISGFKPSLLAPDFADLEKLVKNLYFSDAEYHLVSVLQGGKVTAEVRDWRGELLYSGNHNDISSQGENGCYQTPDARFDLWSYSLTRTAFNARTTSLAEVRDWLNAFGGVHVYMNGLRVTPYGNAGNDWLEMNLSRVRSPEERPSTNNSIGRVSIHDPRGLLRQKTDRSGFIESQEFGELQRFAVDSLEWMARQRLATAERRRRQNRQDTAKTAERSRTTVQEQISKVPDPVREELSSAFDRYSAARDRETDALRKEIQLYRTLSTAGITTATFAHETNGGPLKIIGQSVRSIEHRAKLELGARYAELFGGPVERIKTATNSLGVLAQATLRLLDQDKRRVGRVDLHTVVTQVLETFTPFLDGRDVILCRNLAPGNPYLRGTAASVESIMTNLINNSLAAFEDSTVTPRKLQIESRIVDNMWQFRVSDNGPGIVDISLREIWLPGQTRRSGGTGLGLTIVRDAVSDLGGETSALAHGDLGGATFMIDLPILGA